MKVSMHNSKTNNKLVDLTVQKPVCQQPLQFNSDSSSRAGILADILKWQDAKTELFSTKAWFLNIMISSSSCEKSEEAPSSCKMFNEEKAGR